MDIEFAHDDSKRIAKLVRPVSLAVEAASLVLLVNLPKSIDPKLTILYNAHLALLCLSFFTSLGLSMYSIINLADYKQVVWVQKRVMIVSINFILISFVMSCCVVLSISWKNGDSDSNFAASSIDRVWFIGG